MGEIVPRNDATDTTSRLFRETAKSLVEGITGVAVSGRADLILSLSHIFQRARSGIFLSVLLKEWDKYREKGRVKDDYVQTEQHQQCLQEMLDFLDRDSPDAPRFSMLKAIFLGAATESMSSRDSVLPQQYMSLCRTLSSGEVLVLNSTFALTERGGTTVDSQASTWLEVIAKESGLDSNELVEIHERKLIEKNLLTNRTFSDRSGIRGGPNLRLTPLAVAICRFIKEFDKNGTVKS